MDSYDHASLTVRKPSMLADPETCAHPLEARRVGGRDLATIVCVQCGVRAETHAAGRAVPA